MLRIDSVGKQQTTKAGAEDRVPVLIKMRHIQI